MIPYKTLCVMKIMEGKLLLYFKILFLLLEKTLNERLTVNVRKFLGVSYPSFLVKLETLFVV